MICSDEEEKALADIENAARLLLDKYGWHANSFTRTNNRFLRDNSGRVAISVDIAKGPPMPGGRW